MAARPVLRFDRGTLLLEGVAPAEAPAGFVVDPRTRELRAPAHRYADAMRALFSRGVDDRARAYQELPGGLVDAPAPRPYQRQALEAWREARGRGVVVLPTGAGKTQLALMAIDDRRRAALVVVPTLELMRQWWEALSRGFRTEVGLLGGGEHRVLPLTVTTYDSAYLHMADLGARFGTIVFDEVHHLPAPSLALAAEQCLAPFRLGLTATPERADGRDEELVRLVGPTVFRRDIVEMSGRWLSDYETVRVVVELSPEERAEYEEARAEYLAFVRSQGIRMGSPAGWREFLVRASRGERGRRALAAYRRQRAIMLGTQAKLSALGGLLAEHREERTLVFTQDNAMAHRIAEHFLVPVITHQTRVPERAYLLGAFARGELSVLVTSRVLNEGVDVPEASVAVVVSGSGSVREHVQRLGRILRPRAGKRAVLYELVSGDTAETHTSDRRRAHDAYRSERA